MVNWLKGHGFLDKNQKGFTNISVKQSSTQYILTARNFRFYIYYVSLDIFFH